MNDSPPVLQRSGKVINSNGIYQVTRPCTYLEAFLSLGRPLSQLCFDLLQIHELERELGRENAGMDFRARFLYETNSSWNVLVAHYGAKGQVTNEQIFPLAYSKQVEFHPITDFFLIPDPPQK